MNPPVVITEENADQYFRVERLAAGAPIEHDAGVLAFYQKSGFAPNSELSGKRRKTISMRLDLYS